MNLTNVDKTALAEKDRLDNSTLPTTSFSHLDAARAAQRKRVIMSRIQHVCFVLLALALLAVTFVNANAANEQTAVITDAQQFRQLLETIDDATLHEILHDHFKGKYQHGIFEEDKAAMESLHRENAAVATSLVQLAKRQSNGTTVVTTTAVTEVTQEVTITSTSTPIDVPPTETTPPPPPETTPDVPPPAPTTTDPPVEDTPTPTPTPSTSSTTTVETSSSSTSTTSSETSTSITTTSSTSSTLATSSRPVTSSRTSRPVTDEDVTTEIFYTTTLADGAASVVTRVTVVPANQATQIARPSASTTGGSNASLQTGAANIINQRGWTAGLGVGIAMVWAW